MKKLLILLLLIQSSIMLNAQQKSKIYKLKQSGEKLTQKQADSLRKVHGDNLKINSTINGTEEIIEFEIVYGTIQKEVKKQQTFTFQSSPSAGSSKKNEIEGEEFKDENGNIISKEVFKDKVTTQGYSIGYSMNLNELTGKYKRLNYLILSEDAKKKMELSENEFKRNWLNKKISLNELTDINGITINDKSLKGKIVVLNFWFIGCAPCRKEMPQLNKLVNKYAGNKNIHFLAPALDPAENLKDFLKQSSFLYKILPDAGLLANKMGIYSYPTHLILNKDGLITDIFIGALPDIEDKINQAILRLNN